MELKSLQKLVHNWIVDHGIRYFDILTNTILLSEEVGEISRIIARNYGEQSKKKNCRKSEDLGEELSDVLFIIACLANQTGIDLEKSFYKKLKKKEIRDHDRHYNNQKLK
ncbi:nucleotide pyrophosphohydrolase [Blattabacterium cuenoti]|uniref:Mazg nucleotide pyrophosphohydrolase n=1 Tax=Blattabacterium cuenoti STAT TaxID=1457030 RepID=A0A224AJY6_9FLAO|nr:nucleotide pyrophosphohydrolase [Blattabacterium cuenoti]BBA17174.1 mazg nucleotide pyrophosphohydrolase [Blattabacterium cuenoti STAT]